MLVACTLIGACTRADAPATARLNVTDDAQRTVEVPQPATRVVSLMPTVTDLIIAMGHSSRLIARTDYDVDPRIAHLPSTGGGLTPSVEWLAAQKPELVISWPDNPSRSVVSRLHAVGVPTYAARTETIADALRTVKNLGVLLDAQSSADSLTTAITSALDSVRRAVAGLKTVRVAYVLSIEPPTIAGPGTFIDELIQVAGGVNVFADVGQLWPQVNLEEIVRRDPDVIVLARESGTDPQGLLAKRAGWRDLRAVRTNRVYVVSPDYFNRSGPLMPRAARELAGFFANAR
jgi:iron complex transport system substrate-binding protein